MRVKKILLAISCLLLGGSLSVVAQDDNYDPQNPEEPSAVDICRIKVSADPAEGAYVSGGGKYKVNGNSIWISTSARNTEDYTYTFKYWTVNGVQTSYSEYFEYYPTKGDFEFVAHYEKAEVVFDPDNPTEPSSANAKRKYFLYLTPSIEGACSFNMASGEKIKEETQLDIATYPNNNYKFEGWKLNGQIISTSSYLSFKMPSANTTLEACYSEIPFDPENPIEPSSQGGNVDNSTRKIVELTIGDDNGVVDKTRIAFNEKRSLDYEAGCDASKFISNTANFQIYSISDDVKYSVNERPFDNGEVAIGIIVKNAGSVTIAANKMEYSAVLIDKGLSVQHDLSDGGYTFTSEAGTFNDRFYIKATTTEKFKLTYQVDGYEYKSVFIQAGEAITAEAEPTKEGYTFSGWSNIPTTMPAKNVTVTGTFTINKYKLVYKVDGEDYKSYDVEYGKAITAETAPTKEGYTFSGWSDIPETMPAKDVTITGSFSVNNYKLIYKVDGEDYKSYDVEYGSTITPEAEPTKDGYIFSGWSEIPETMPAKDVTITGTFAVIMTPPTGKSGLVYNGAALDLITAGSSIIGTMQYSLDGTTYATTIPQGTDAGSYTVYYRVKGDGNYSDIAAQSLDVTIASKTVESPTITFSETSYTYDGTAIEPTVTVKDGGTMIPSTEYSVSYTNNTNVGTATVTITDVEGGNYTVSGSATFAISSADGSLTPPTGKSNLVYNGAAQELITAGSTTTGTMEYSLDGTTYAETIPQGTNAGSYTVYYKVIGDANHNDIAAQNFQVTIAAKTVDSPSITLSETSYTYDGSAKEPAVTVKDGETTIPATEYSVSYTNNTNVGTATVTITDVEGGNYAVSGSTTFAISSADGSLNPPVGKSDLVYNGTAQDLITAGSTTTGTMEYSLDGTTYSTSIPQGTDAGSYTVYYKVTGDDDNSNIAAQDFQVTIAAKTVDSPSITLSETSYTYDGTAKKPTVTVDDGETTIPSSEYSVSYTNNTNAGTATVTITDVEGGNYAVSGSTTFTISVADGSLTAPTGTSDLVYNGTAQNLITAGSTTTGTMEYSLDGTTYDTGIPQGTDAGSYTVYYKVTGDANHNDIAAQHFDVTIAKAALTVSAGNYEIFEGEEIPSFEIKYDGFVNNETADALITKPTISCEATVGSKPDEYKVTVSGAEAKNYEITYVDGKLTILAKSFVSGGDDDKDEDDPATYQITSNEGEGDTPPTVAITEDKDVSGAFDIPEAVTYHNKTYTVTEIGEGAFENNTNLTSVSIPSSITNIGDKAFKGCSNLKSITVYITTPISLSVLAATRRMMTRADGSSVFDGVDKATCILYVPEGSVDLYKAAPAWCEFKNILAIGSTGIKEILMTDGEAHDVYNLQGRKVKAKATSLEGLPRGVYVVKGKKISIN